MAEDGLERGPEGGERVRQVALQLGLRRLQVGVDLAERLLERRAGVGAGLAVLLALARGVESRGRVGVARERGLACSLERRLRSARVRRQLVAGGLEGGLLVCGRVRNQVAAGFAAVVALSLARASGRVAAPTCGRADGRLDGRRERAQRRA